MSKKQNLDEAIAKLVLLGACGWGLIGAIKLRDKWVYNREKSNTFETIWKKSTGVKGARWKQWLVERLIELGVDVDSHVYGAVVRFEQADFNYITRRDFGGDAKSLKRSRVDAAKCVNGLPCLRLPSIKKIKKAIKIYN